MRPHYYIGLIIVFSFTAFAQYAPAGEPFAGSLFFTGDTVLTASPQTVSPGDEIEFTIDISNGEQYPIADGIFVLRIADGEPDPPFPSQTSDNDNYFYQKIITGINMWPESQIVKKIKYKIPEDMKEGNYRVESYFRTKKTPVSGIAHIFIPGDRVSFAVVSSDGNFPSARILRTKTFIKSIEYAGPVGPPFDKGTATNLEVYVDGNQFDSKLRVLVCPWHDDGCEEKVFEKTVNVPAGTQQIPIKIPVPDQTDAYAIRIELFDNERLLSTYNSRMISAGEGGKVRKLVISEFPLKANQAATILVAAAGSPDHYNYPITEDTELEVWVDDKNTGERLFEETEDLPPLDSNMERFVKKAFSFVPEVDTGYFEVCAQVKREKVFDKACYTYDVNKFPFDNYDVSATPTWYSDKEILKVDLCLENAYGDHTLPVSYILNAVPERYGNTELTPCSEIKFEQIPKGTYTFTVSDPVKERQLDFTFDLEEQKKPVEKQMKEPEKKQVWIVEERTALVPLLVLLLLLMILVFWVWRRAQK